jgi:hypothetical protein
MAFQVVEFFIVVAKSPVDKFVTKLISHFLFLQQWFRSGQFSIEEWQTERLLSSINFLILRCVLLLIGVCLIALQ